jgi:hypothetical protein
MLNAPSWMKAALDHHFIAGCETANAVEPNNPMPSDVIVGEIFEEDPVGLEQRAARTMLAEKAQGVLASLYSTANRRCPNTPLGTLRAPGIQVDDIKPEVQTVTHYKDVSRDQIAGHTVTVAFSKNRVGYMTLTPVDEAAIACVQAYLTEINAATQSVAVAADLTCNVHADFLQSAPSNAAALFMSCGPTHIPNPTGLDEYYNHQAGTSQSFVRKP